MHAPPIVRSVLGAVALAHTSIGAAYPDKPAKALGLVK
jgi:hypothetical protein